MALIEACVCLANYFAVVLGVYACALRAADVYIGNEPRVQTVYMLQIMWLIAVCVFSYFHVTMEITNPIINTPHFFLRIMFLLFFTGPFVYCPIFTLLHWMISY